jgi:hypothetical protein
MNSLNFSDIQNICSEEYQKLVEVDEMKAQPDRKLDSNYT